jgi:hypothetical protein
MSYRVALPKNKENFATKAESPGSVSLPFNTGNTGNTGNKTLSTDPTEGRVIAYLIASEVLGADIWFALDDSFKPDDGLAVFYPDELSFLATKDAETLKEIHKNKLTFGGRVTQ